MSDQFKTLIVTAADAETSRAIAACFGPGGVGMWTTPLSATGSEPATHYISSGFVPPEYAAMSVCTFWQTDGNGGWIEDSKYPGDAATVAAYATQAGLSLTAAQVQGIFDRSDVSEQDPFVAMDRLGLQIINESEA